MKDILLKPGIDLNSFKKKWGWFLAWGILLIILGMTAITISGITTLISVIFLGFIIFLAGIVITIDTFSFWWGKWKGFFLHLILGILYLVAGALLIKHPVFASISLTFILGIFYIIVGSFRSIYYASLQSPNWGWGLFSGLIALMLGIFIIASWPASSLYIIGLFIGIDLVFSGWSYVMMALAGRRLLQKDARGH